MPTKSIVIGFVIAGAVVIFGGCAGYVQKSERLCAGKESVEEAIETLKLAAKNAKPFRANGQCVLRYYADRKPRKENFEVKLWVNPPAEIYMQGDVAFNPKGVILGSNKDEFWLVLKPKEISGYWWGQWVRQRGFVNLIISPRALLEGFGIVGGAEEGHWSFAKEDAFDVLIKKGRQGQVQKIYVERCDYSIRKIEYLDSDGKVLVRTQLGKYKEVGEGFSVPMLINIARGAEGEESDFLEITIRLKSARQTSFNAEQKNALFLLPKPVGVKNVYEIINGKMVRQ